jgi:integrase
MKRNLCLGLQFVIELPKVNNIKTEDLTPEQLENLLKVLDQEKDIHAAAMIRLALYTGMRRGEMFRLKWQDLDFQRGFIKLVDPKNGKDSQIPMNDSALNLFRDHPRTESEYVFPGRKGGPRTDIKRALTRIKKATGLPNDFRILHGLRHVYASILASSGQVDMFHLQKLLNHQSPQMTQRYAHLRDEALRNASNVLTDQMQSFTSK